MAFASFGCLNAYATKEAILFTLGMMIAGY